MTMPRARTASFLTAPPERIRRQANPPIMRATTIAAIMPGTAPLPVHATGAAGIRACYHYWFPLLPSPHPFPSALFPGKSQGHEATPPPEHFPFETLGVSNHTVWHFAKKRGFSAHFQPGGAVLPPRILPFSKAKCSKSKRSAYSIFILSIEIICKICVNRPKSGFALKLCPISMLTLPSHYGKSVVFRVFGCG